MQSVQVLQFTVKSQRFQKWTERTTAIPTFQRLIRSASFMLRSLSAVMLSFQTAEKSVCTTFTSKRTQESSFISTATHMLTITVAVFLLSKLFQSLTFVQLTRRESMLKSFSRLCVTSEFPTVKCRKAQCVAM